MTADHRGGLQYFAGLVVHRVHAGEHHALHRIGNVYFVDRRGGLPAVARLHEGALVDERPEYLFDVEGVALGVGADSSAQGYRQAGCPQQARDQSVKVVVVKR